MHGSEPFIPQLLLQTGDKEILVEQQVTALEPLNGLELR
jgi:hypothetical protein